MSIFKENVTVIKFARSRSFQITKDADVMDPEEYSQELYDTYGKQKVEKNRAAFYNDLPHLMMVVGDKIIWINKTMKFEDFELVFNDKDPRLCEILRYDEVGYWNYTPFRKKIMEKYGRAIKV